MTLRKMVAAIAPILLTLGACKLFGVLDGFLGSNTFGTTVLKGIVIAVVLVLCLPLSGLRLRASGFAHWMSIAAVTLWVVLLYQFLEQSNVLHIPALRSLLVMNGQTVLFESTAAAYLTILWVWRGKR